MYTIDLMKRYVEYCMKQVGMLKKFKVRPLIVFDGGYLPAKSHTELMREKFVFPFSNAWPSLLSYWSIRSCIRKRQESRQIGQELFKEGRVRESFKFFKKSVSVTPEMAYKFIEVWLWLPSLLKKFTLNIGSSFSLGVTRRKCSIRCCTLWSWCTIGLPWEEEIHSGHHNRGFGFTSFWLQDCM